MKTLCNAIISISCLFLLTSCGGGGSGGGVAGPTNVGGGFTLVVSGGTLNDGSGTNGLAVLASLRDAHGVGPGLIGNWTITISGPGLTQPLRVDYDDDTIGSYYGWKWKEIEPLSGTYTASATNGTTTLTYKFIITSSSKLLQPEVIVIGNKASWVAVAGAGSYRYSINAAVAANGLPVATGYIPATTAGPYSFDVPSLPDGSYVIEVVAQTQDRVELSNNTVSSPSLATQDNLSVATKDLPITGGNNGSYLMTAKGGVLYMGNDGANDRFGLAIWTSILTNSGSLPAGDWTVTVTSPNISPITFTYLKTSSHYLYWDYDTPPASGVYTVTATNGTSELTTTFTIPDLAAKLDVATNIQVSSGPTGYLITWNTVPGAQSYYVNLWADIGGNYTEVANGWVTGTSGFIPKVNLTKGMLYDVYITASSENMTTSNEVPPPSPTQVNMSDNTFAEVSFTAK